MVNIQRRETKWCRDQILVRKHIDCLFYISANGDQYDGEYLNGKKNGPGIYTYADLIRKEKRKYDKGKLLESTLMADKEWILLT